MDLARAFSELKSLPDTALQKELATPTGAIPGYMVVGELHERKALRARAGSPDEVIKRKSMAEEYMGDIKSMMPQGMQPSQAMPPQAVLPQPPAGGGIASLPPPQGFSNGGLAFLQPPERMASMEDYEEHFPVQGYARGGIVSLANGGAISSNFRERLIATANSLGISPHDLATVISYETGGTFSPTQAGPTTKWGQHRGLIQFGEPQAKQYGVDWNDPLNSQLGPEGAVAKYLRGAGVKPGMGLMDVYSAVNAGAPGRYGASDAAAGGAPGTVADKVNNQMAGHRANAVNLLGGTLDPTAVAAADTASASGVVAAQAADTASQMQAAESGILGKGGSGGPLSQILAMQQLSTMFAPPPAPAAAPVAASAPPKQPVDYEALAEETSMNPDFYKRKRASYG
ncbi:MAG TPA: hypothetical protein VFZ07_10250 [Dongiaceae bacterium]